MIIQTENLTKRYGRFTALADCSLSTRPGEVLGLLGPNGSGKTTLLRLVMGFIKPTEGSSRVDGLDSFRESIAIHRRIAYLPGEARLFRRMKPPEAIRFFAKLRPAGRSERGIQIAERLGLDMSRRVANMSTGMRQKLALAITWIADAQIMILDEPTANLDPSVRDDVLALVAEARDEGRTIVFSSHVLSEVEMICSRVVMLKEGELVHTQVMSELRRKHRVTAKCPPSLPIIPTELSKQVRVTGCKPKLAIEVEGELAPVLPWLAEQKLRHLQIEPVGIRGVYDNFHKHEKSSAV